MTYYAFTPDSAPFITEYIDELNKYSRNPNAVACVHYKGQKDREDWYKGSYTGWRLIHKNEEIPKQYLAQFLLLS